MKPLLRVALAASLTASVACYHATIETGRTPSTEVINKGFASGWLYGIVPPSTVNTAQQCPSGVARVETMQSVPNYLAMWLTLGIYSPMTIKVTCAQGGTASGGEPAPELRVPAGATEADVVRVMGVAADRAVATGQPVFVQF